MTMRNSKSCSANATILVVGAQRGETIVKGAPSLVQAAGIVRAWAIAHGLAVLLLDAILGDLPCGETEETLLQAVLKRR